MGCKPGGADRNIAQQERRLNTHHALLQCLTNGSVLHWETSLTLELLMLYSCISLFSLKFRINHFVKKIFRHIKFKENKEKFKERFPGQIPHYSSFPNSFHKLLFSLVSKELLKKHCKDSNEINFSLQPLSDHLIIILQSGTSCSLSISDTTIHLSHFLSLSETIPTLSLSLIIFLMFSSWYLRCYMHFNIFATYTALSMT